ncbi:MAG: hypothetical protein QHG98_07510 [Methanothrix sp.]|jgi:hypothetical protein|nr:hypothetical protein [Methanothrix sp.]
MIKPHLEIAGWDVSEYVKSIRAELCSDVPSEANKIDIELVNCRQQFYGAFVPEDPISCSVTVTKDKCVTVETREWKWFEGHVQKVSVHEDICKIEASGTHGGFSGNLKKTYQYSAEELNVYRIVNDLLNDYGWTGGRVIDTAVKHIPKNGMKFEAGSDYFNAFNRLQDLTGAIYFVDEDNTFYFIDPNKAARHAINLDGYLLRGTQDANIIGYRNVITVIGSSPHDPITDPDGAAIPSQSPTHRYMKVGTKEELEENGVLYAPPVYLIGANAARCKQVAENLYIYYQDREDVCKPTVVSMIPPVASVVSYTPANRYGIPGADCIEHTRYGPSMKIVGIVVKAVTTLDSSGLVSELEVDTHSLSSSYVEIDKVAPDQVVELSDEDLERLNEALTSPGGE